MRDQGVTVPFMDLLRGFNSLLEAPPWSRKHPKLEAQISSALATALALPGTTEALELAIRAGGRSGRDAVAPFSRLPIRVYPPQWQGA